MKQILLNGCGGRMGRVIAAICREREDLHIAAGVDPGLPEMEFPVYSSCRLVKEKIDVIIDFSFHAAIFDLLAFAEEAGVPVVIATTGFTTEELERIAQAEKKIPVFRSANMSLGVNLLCELASRTAKLLPGFDIEIIEKHHNQKVDAPSGTALMIADEISHALGREKQYVKGRSGICGKRTPDEIGIHAVRGGTMVGEHEVLFSGFQETISITHTAQSREILAAGALHAVTFILGKAPGAYSMKDIVLFD